MINGIVKLRIVVYEEYVVGTRISAMFEKNMPAYALFPELLDGSVRLVNTFTSSEPDKPIATIEVGVKGGNPSDVECLLREDGGWNGWKLIHPDC